MKCSIIKPLIYPLVDDELSQQQRKTVLEHIMECLDCREEYQGALEAKALISSHIQEADLSALSLVENKTYRRERIMKKPLALALIASVLALSIILPVYGRDMLDAVQSWVSQLDINSDDAAYSIRTDLIGDPDVSEQPSRAAEYASLDRALEDFEFPVVAPKYIPSRYRLFNIKTLCMDEGLTNLLVVDYYDPAYNGGEPSLAITYEFIDKDVKDREVRYTQGTLVKETKVSGYPALFHKKFHTSGASAIGLDIFLNQGKSTMLRIHMFVGEEDFRHSLADLEQEMLRIATSIVE